MIKTVDAARGKWRGILLQLGIEDRFLRDKHGPCPMCGGKDRFRWDNRDGNGTYICGQCGAGNGLDLLMNVKGMVFLDAAREVDRVSGNAMVEKPKQRLNDESRSRMLNELWAGSKPIERGDLVFRYLSARGINLTASLEDIRFCESCRAPDGSYHPAMVAMVRQADDVAATLHRTFLGDGCKADMSEPRAVMPGSIPPGSAIRLTKQSEVLGIAEGIETAFHASAKFGIPVWAAINSTMLKKWEAPDGVKQVVIFGDNDIKFGGHAAAYALAHRLAVKNISVTVKIPEQTGMDWADSKAA
mgnify:CR=1 FL=1